MKILIVRLGALGDIVHAIPVAAALRRAHPDAQIDWLVSGKHRAILDLVPVIDHRIVVNDRGEGGGQPMGQVIRGLRRTGYDVTIDLQGLIKSAAIARGSGARRVIGFARRYLREGPARLFYSEAYDPGGPGLREPGEVRHVVAINLGVLTLLGIDAGTPEFPIDRPESSVARQMRDRINGRYALLNPGAAWPNKRWPSSRFGALASTVRAEHGLQSVVLWGPAERALAEAVAADSHGAALVAPETTIADIVALARGAAVMISGDTGPTHIGAAVGVPIVGIFGPTRPERNGPWSAADETVSRAGVCRCHHLRRCRLETPCLLDIEVDEVAQAVGRRLSKSAAAQGAGAGR